MKYDSADAAFKKTIDKHADIKHASIKITLFIPTPCIVAYSMPSVSRLYNLAKTILLVFIIHL